jgi:Spy/CpxP family protein refolding chaperone
MNKKIAAILIAALIVAGISGIANAQNTTGIGGMNTEPGKAVFKKRPPCGEMNTGIDFTRIMRRPNLAQDLGITPDQGQEIMQKLDNVKAKMEEELDNACRASEDLKKAVIAENPDHNEISRLIDDLTYARQDLLKTQADLLFDVIEILTPDQWAAFRQIAAKAEKPDKKDSQKKKGGR